MMKYFFKLIMLLLISSHIQGASYLGNIDKMQWEDLEVIYLEDDRFPTYTMLIYFADGALSDGSHKGLTSAMFSFLSLGTTRYDQKDIADNLEFFGASYAPHVTHEYSSYLISGLVKDINPTVKKICHLFDAASFPKDELKSEKRRISSTLRNVITNPQALASMAFREESLSGTPYSYPADGKLADIKNWSQSRLKEKLNYFNNKVKKKIYITGPKSILSVKKVINEECGWKGSGSYTRALNYQDKKKRTKARITLVDFDKANQAQVRIGSFLNANELNQPELMDLASEYLGGGFTSKLMTKLRKQRGLIYSVGAFAGGQKQYGRVGIITATGVPTVGKLLNETKKVIDEAKNGDIPKEDLVRTKGSMAGGYLFGFESTSALLTQLMFLDHVNRDYNDLVEYPKKVRAFKKDEVSQMIDKIYNWSSQDIIVVGPKSIKSQLEKLGDVTVVPINKYL